MGTVAVRITVPWTPGQGEVCESSGFYQLRTHGGYHQTSTPENMRQTVPAETASIARSDIIFIIGPKATINI